VGRPVLCLWHEARLAHSVNYVNSVYNSASSSPPAETARIPGGTCGTGCGNAGCAAGRPRTPQRSVPTWTVPFHGFDSTVSMNPGNVPDRKTLPHPGPLPVAAPLAKGEGELSADCLLRQRSSRFRGSTFNARNIAGKFFRDSQYGPSTTKK